MNRIHKPFFVIAHNIRSLYNVGSIFRTADAFGVSGIFLTGYTGRPDEFGNMSKISKSALGAEKFVPWEGAASVSRLIKRLKSKYPKIKIIALENNVKAVSLAKFKPEFPLALVLGEETKGIPASLMKLCDQAVEIPMFGKKESLNVSVAFGVAAFYIKTQASSVKRLVLQLLDAKR